MHDSRNCCGERFLRRSFLGIAHELFRQLIQLVSADIGKQRKVTHDIGIGGVEPELVKEIRGSARRIQPDSALFRLAEFLPGRSGEKREGQAENLVVLGNLSADKLHTRRNITPLIRPADLQPALILAVQMIVVVCLEQHVAELGVAYSLFSALQPCADAFFGDHGVHGEMLSHIPQKIDVVQFPQPIVVLHQQERVRALSFKKETDLRGYAGNVFFDLLFVQQCPLFGFARRIPDEPCGRTDQGNGPMTGALKFAHEEERQHAADMQT